MFTFFHWYFCFCKRFEHLFQDWPSNDSPSEMYSTSSSLQAETQSLYNTRTNSKFHVWFSETDWNKVPWIRQRLTFSSDYSTHSLWHHFDKLMQHHSTYFRPELNSFFTNILFWWWESRAAASSLSSTSRDSQKGSGLNVNMMSHALFHSLSPMKRGVVILEYTRVIGEKNLLIQYIQVVSWPHFLGHFSWLASLISVLSLGYTAVQYRTLQFSSHCVWKYSYSTVKHIRELYCWVLTFSFHQTFQWTLTDHPRFLSWTYFLLKDECSPRSLQV